jgi:hypothetical protein
MYLSADTNNGICEYEVFDMLPEGDDVEMVSEDRFIDMVKRPFEGIITAEVKIGTYDSLKREYGIH